MYADRRTQDNSGTIEREEFLSLPQISSNPLATRSVISVPTSSHPPPQYIETIILTQHNETE
jgi:hypothetical protein